jgi:hypothetical protein
MTKAHGVIDVYGALRGARPRARDRLSLHMWIEAKLAESAKEFGAGEARRNDKTRAEGGLA